MQKFFLTIGLMILVNSIFAQHYNTDSENCPQSSLMFEGTILDPNGEIVADAVIKVEGANRNIERQSSKKGKFTICLPKGTYQFKVTADGFKFLILKDYKLESEKDTKFDFKLDYGRCSDCGEWFPDKPST